MVSIINLERVRLAILIFCSIWNWQKGTRLNKFSNGNPRGSKVNETRFINEDDQALLMTGSSDGMVKVLRNYESEKNIELVTSFRALADMVPSNKNAGLVFDWQQGQGKLIVAGDVKVIRVWNAATEICTNVGIYLSTKPLQLLTRSGYTRTLRLVYHLVDIRPSRWSRIRCWLWRRRHTYVRSTRETSASNGQSLERAQTMDHKYPHAARRFTRTSQR